MPFYDLYYRKMVPRPKKGSKIPKKAFFVISPASGSLKEGRGLEAVFPERILTWKIEKHFWVWIVWNE